MMVASGTSTPTSITVVATRSCGLARFEGGHGGVAFGALSSGHAPGRLSASEAALAQHGGAFFGGGQVDLFGFLDQRANPIGALALGPAPGADG